MPPTFKLVVFYAANDLSGHSEEDVVGEQDEVVSDIKIF